ncbi:MAG: response regulator [Epsilonproteobacteria bacterium]|nr:response regulator [Campylobacterota bacterium]
MREDAKKILIVEDDIIAAQFLREVLEDAGYEIFKTVTNGKEAIKKASELKPDLILMDIILDGEMSGCEAAVYIKKNQKNCKIIFLTAYAEQEMVAYATQCQASSYLLKPYREDEILATLAVVFSQEAVLSDQIKEEVLLAHGFSFHFNKCQLYHHRQEVPLSEKKRKLLELLAKNIDTSVSNEQICTYVWGEQRSLNTVRSLVHRLKEAIGIDLIQNTSGAGYVLRSQISHCS